jgi:ABC-type multidrug transport system fused ATPase/permease subunit
MITIAHRLNTIISSDRVLILSFGQVLEYDTPASLMRDPDSEFSKLLQELKKEEEEKSSKPFGETSSSKH